MTPLRRVGFAACALWLACAPAAAAGDAIVFIAPTNHAMPFVEFDNGHLSGGILKDLGEAIAQRMKLRAQFLRVPSKRVDLVLRSGEADGVCYVMPRWISGDFNWSRPFIPNRAVLASRADAPPVRSLKDLAGLRVGTVLGYHYAELDDALGPQFLRDDAPAMAFTMSKLAAGRTRYAIIDQATLMYHLREDKSLKLRSDLLFDAFQARCAFSRASRLPFAQVETAINALIADGSIDAILARYR